VLVGNWAGCAPALVFAATHPGRVESLVLLGGYARLRAGAGYPRGLDQADIDQIFDAILGTWGTGADMGLVAPSVAAERRSRWHRLATGTCGSSSAASSTGLAKDSPSRQTRGGDAALPMN
jgi:pimeloyl-ACP methyl ester carboxylesterase